METPTMCATDVDANASEERAFRNCEHCGAWNADSVTTCRDCGRTLIRDSDIAFSLTFSAETCPACGQVSPESPCIHCGAAVPDVAEVSEVALARQKSFAALLDRAEELFASYDELPEPHVPVAPDQYATALADVRLLTRVRVVLRALRRLGELDFNHADAISGATRGTLKNLVRQLEEIHRATEEIAWFRAPSDEVARARAAMIASARYGTEIVVTLFRALTATTLEEVVPLQARFQELLSSYAWEGEFDAALAALRELPSVDIDRRVGVALGTNVSVTDSLGLLDPARVLAAFGGSDDPFTPLARASARFLSHLTDIAADEVGAEGAALALGALALAVLDRPLSAHRTARQAVELIRAAEQVDAAATHALLERTSNEGPRIFAATKRIHDDLAYLAEDLARDEDDAVRRLVTTYKTLAESSFRSYVWLVIDAQQIAEGKQVKGGTRPMLGQLQTRLSARSDPLSKTLAHAVDTALRNAEAHEDFRFDRKTGRIVLEGKRLTLEQFETRVERLLGTSLALDAAFSCRAFEVGGSRVPQWLTSGDAPYATEMLTRGILGAYEIDVLSLEDNHDITVTANWPAPNAARALTPLAALAQLFPDSNRLELIVQDEPLIRVETAAFHAFAEADEEVKDLALLAPMFSALTEAGRDRADALEDVLALFIGMIAATDVPRLKVAIAIGNAIPLAQLEKRLAYIIRFVRERDPNLRPPIASVIKSLAEAKSKVLFVRRGDARAFSRMVAALTRAASWADKRGYRWPPF
jgi:hypothetical protein